GSRSSLGIAAVEMVVIFFLSDVVNMKKTLFFLGIFVICFAIFLALTYKTSIGRYILMQIFGVIDHIFGTTISARFGADVTHYANSDGYRDVLPKIFGLDWLNPILGRGVKRHFSATFTGEDGSKIFVSSIDSYYIEQYIKYAYPGMISYIIFIFTALGIILRNAIKYRSGLFKLIFVGVLCYYYNLYWLDALQTLKFVYVFIALALATSVFLEGRLGV
nr:hypothetical protein [Lachnospiraceae bacterium]